MIAFPVQAKLKEAAMRLPEELAQAERLPVAGRQGWRHLQRLEFGEYAVDSVRRSITKGGDLHVMRYEGSKRRQSFAFAHLENGETVFNVGAETNLRRRALDVGVDLELRNQSGFVAELHSALNAKEASTLDLQETRARPLAGTLAHGDQVIKVEGTAKLAGTPFPLDETTGYVFEASGRPIAAVEVINDGAVWLSPSINPELRRPVSAAISALLLFEELRKTLPE